MWVFSGNLGALLEVPGRPLGGGKDLSSVCPTIGRAFKIYEILFVLEIILAEENLHVLLGTRRSLQIRIQSRHSVKKQTGIGTPGPKKKNSQGFGTHEENNQGMGPQDP